MLNIILKICSVIAYELGKKPKPTDEEKQIKNSLKDNQMFDIIYINMDRHLDRNQHMIKILNKANCEYSRFTAVDGEAIFKRIKTFEDYCKDLNLKDVHNISNLTWTLPKYSGIIGCKLSHYLVMKIIEISENNKPVLVLEDDIDLETDFILKIEEGLKELPEDWDMLLLSRNFLIANSEYNKNLKKTAAVYKFYETTGYLVNKSSSAKKIADLISDRCLNLYPIDEFFGEMAIAKKLNVFAFLKKLVIQRRDLFESSIVTSTPINDETLENALTNVV